MENIKKFTLSIIVDRTPFQNNLSLHIDSGDPQLIDMMLLITALVGEGEKQQPGYKRDILKILSKIEEAKNEEEEKQL